MAERRRPTNPTRAPLNYKRALLRPPPAPPGFAPWDDQQAVLSLIRQRMKHQLRHYGKGIHVSEDPRPRGGSDDRRYVLRCLRDILDGMIVLSAALVRMERRLE